MKKMTNLPENWTICKLEDCLSITMGQSPNSNSYNENRIGLPFYQGSADFGELYPISRKWCSAPIKIAEKNDVLLSIRAPVGHLNICYEKSCIGRGLSALHGKGNISNHFVFFLLKNLQQTLHENSTGTTFLAITGERLKNISIPLPPLAEQERIVAKIEELFADIDAGVENLKSVKNQIALYRQSVLKSAFDGTLYKTTKWNFTSIGTVCDINPKTVLPDFSDDSIVSFLPMPTVEAETGAFSPETVEYKKVKKGYTKFQNNDVLFAKITPCMENGKSCVVRDLIQGVGFGSTEFHVLRCHAGMLPEYVFYFVVQKVFRSKAIPFMTGAVGQKRVPADYLRDCEIPVPTLDEQKRIVAEIESRFERADTLETAVDRALNDAEKLKQAVLKKAFSGELVPQNPDDEPASVLLDRIRAARASELPAKKGKRK